MLFIVMSLIFILLFAARIISFNFLISEKYQKRHKNLCFYGWQGATLDIYETDESWTAFWRRQIYGYLCQPRDFNLWWVRLQFVEKTRFNIAIIWHMWRNGDIFHKTVEVLDYCDWIALQVNLCQKHFFLHQLTHNMTKDCSLNYKFSTWKF